MKKDILKLKTEGKGITLIALVITIIVLLILAGVSISMLTGDNGILAQTKRAKEETERASLIEKVKVDIISQQTKEGGLAITAKQLQIILNKYFSDVPTDETKITGDTQLTATESNGGYKVLVSEIYAGSTKTTNLIAGEMTEEQRRELIGATVTNYTTNGSTADGWVIFNVDEENIYLIASDYISSDNCPNGANGNPITENDTKYKLSMGNVYGGYAGASSITDSRLQALNSSFFKSFSDTTNTHIKAVAYMLDTTAWSGFAGTDAEYAIGGPSIELLFDAYNRAYPDETYPNGKYKAQATDKTGTGEDIEKGYEISWDGGSTYNIYTTTTAAYLDTTNPAFVIESPVRADGTIIASPATNIYCLFALTYYGGINTAGYNNSNHGFRPVVCLNPTVELNKTGDNTYEIVK